MYIDTGDKFEAAARQDELLSGEVRAGARGAICGGPSSLARGVSREVRRHPPRLIGQYSASPG